MKLKGFMKFNVLCFPFYAPSLKIPLITIKPFRTVFQAFFRYLFKRYSTNKYEARNSRIMISSYKTELRKRRRTSSY